MVIITAVMATTYVDFLSKYRTIEDNYLDKISDLESTLGDYQQEVSELHKQISNLQAILNEIELANGSLHISPEMLYNMTIMSTVQVTARSGSLFDTSTSTGSGFVYNINGVIVTNNHVVEEASEFLVTFIDGTTLEASLLGTDPYSDIAVLKIDDIPFQLYPLAIGNSSELRVGQKVYAIGNPFGLSGSITEGIVSQLGRSITAVGGYLIVDVIQVDAAINPGNSGGPLLNEIGEVIGVTTAIVTTTGTFSGVGFAIPSDLVKRVVPSLIDQGLFKHPWIGITGLDVTLEIAEEMDLDEVKGFLITTVTPNSPADRAGLRSGNESLTIGGQTISIGGDVIVGIDGKDVVRIEDILSQIERHNVGDTIQLIVIREGSEVTFNLTLGERP
jgi:S1-C subfamily serine protease